MKKVDKFFLFMLLLIQSNFFDLINLRETTLGSITSYSQKKLLLLVVIIYALLRWICYPKSDFKDNITNKFFSFFVYFLILIVIIVQLGTMYKFLQTPVSTVLNSYYFFVILLYFPLHHAFSSWKDLHYFVKMFSVFATILSLLKLIQSFVLLRWHVILFYLNNNADYNTAIQFKYILGPFTRMPTSTDFVFFSFAVFLLVKIRLGIIFSKWIDVVVMSVNMTLIIFVGQTRVYTVASLGILVLFVISVLYRKYGAKLVVPLTGLIALPIIGGFYNLVLTMLGNTDRVASIDIRREAYGYYLQMMNYSKWFGIGFAREDRYAYLVHGAFLLFNLDDVGIIGFLAIFGSAGMAVLLVLIVALIVGYIHSHDKISSLILIYLIVITSISVSLFNPQRIFYLPIVLALSEFMTSDETKYTKLVH